jgi:hypothetical protein
MDRGLDFIPQRRSLTKGNRRIARRRRPADVAKRFDRDLRKTPPWSVPRGALPRRDSHRGAGQEARSRSGAIQHRLIQIGRYDAGLVGKFCDHRPLKRAETRSRFKHILRSTLAIRLARSRA